MDMREERGSLSQGGVQDEVPSLPAGFEIPPLAMARDIGAL